jgi:hypothetical protein
MGIGKFYKAKLRMHVMSMDDMIPQGSGKEDMLAVASGMYDLPYLTG